MNDNDDTDFQTGAKLLSAFGCVTRVQKLDRAVRALMASLEELHQEHKNQSLADNLNNPDVSCSCADAYRMGHEALKT